MEINENKIIRYDLIIAEKETQGEDIALALSVPKVSMRIELPTKESLKFSEKIKSKIKRINNKEAQIEDFESKYQNQGKEYSHLKSYKNLVIMRNKWKRELNDLIIKNKIAQKEASSITIGFWKNDKKIIFACSGHLINIKLKNKHGDLNFDTELKPPSPTNPNEMIAFARLQLITKYLNSDKVARIICATDYDREGESIFGTIMEYNGINLNNCLRMKFSTLEADVLRDAYNNLFPFNINLFNAGKMRRWMDFVIGYNINPNLAKVYRGGIVDYLTKLKIPENAINNIKYNNTFNMGRVKLVVLDYIYNFTKEQTNKLADIENHNVNEQEVERHSFYFMDNEGRRQWLFSEEWLKEKDGFNKLNLEEDILLTVSKIEFKEVYKQVPYDGDEVPTFLNMTKVYQICRDLGSTVEEIKRLLQYLYLQTYISYPRSKSEQWEIPDEINREIYAHSVLNALGDCGYPIKDYYFEGCGNEGNISHSHPCIHPLPSLKEEKIKRLKKINPLAFLIFNKIALHTLKCFEMLAKVNQQIVHFKMEQNEYEFKFQKTFLIELIEENILTFNGIKKEENDFEPELNLYEGEEVKLVINKTLYTSIEIEKNHQEIEMIDDFDVINFLNENDIGTEATRDEILTSLIRLQYFVSPSILLTTFLGNTLTKIAKSYVNFIDIDYTLQIEEKLNEIEKGTLTIFEFKDNITQTILDTYDNIMIHREEIEEIFLDVPKCEVHNVPMVIKSGRYGKFLQCPFYYDDDKVCNQKISI